jgi:hypothetical protein
MTALVRYVLAGLGTSQRYVPPALLFVISVVALTSGGPASLVPSYSVSTLAQFICMTWLTVVLVNAEDPVQRAITAVAAQGSRRVLLADVCAALLVSATLTAFGLTYPIAVGAHPVTASAVGAGLVAMMTGGLSGIAIGLLCSRLVMPRSGYALFAAFGLVLAVLLVPWVPPVNPMLRILAGNPGADHVLPALGINAGICIALLGVSMALTQHIAERHS